MGPTGPNGEYGFTGRSVCVTSSPSLYSDRTCQHCFSLRSPFERFLDEGEDPSRECGCCYLLCLFLGPTWDGRQEGGEGRCHYPIGRSLRVVDTHCHPKICPLNKRDSLELTTSMLCLCVCLCVSVCLCVIVGPPWPPRASRTPWASVRTQRSKYPSVTSYESPSISPVMTVLVPQQSWWSPASANQH